jgi:hypothetical protein
MARVCGFRRPPGPMKRGLGRIPRARTENRHRCPWVNSPRRLGANPGQEGRAGFIILTSPPSLPRKGTRQIGPVRSQEGVPAVLGSPLGPQVAVTRGT